MLRLTVCELHDEPDQFEADWTALVRHVHDERSDIVVLPEMPFGTWLAVSTEFAAAAWSASVAAHDRGLARLTDLGSAAVLASRPIGHGQERRNEGFVWTSASGYRGIRQKRFLPDEVGYWEAHWYQPGEDRFPLADVAGARVGMLICTEMWSMGHAQRFGKAGADLIVTPRVTGKPTIDKWLAGGRVSAVVSGAYHASSNRVARDGGGDFGGVGWIVDPDGRVLVRTSPDAPFATCEIDLAIAAAARRTYPRYALE